MSDCNQTIIVASYARAAKDFAQAAAQSACIAQQSAGATGATGAIGLIGATGPSGGPTGATGATGASTLSFSTPVSASGNPIDFTGIPSWVQRINVMLNDVSSIGSSDYLIRVGTLSSIITSGYNSYCNTFNSSPSGITSTSGFLIDENVGNTTKLHGNLTITKMSNNTWVLTGILADVSFTGISLFGGSVTFAGTLDRIRLTTVNGTDAFDAGTINISYEG